MDFALRIDGRDRALPPGEYVIGRALECDIIVDDAVASRRHARLVVREDGVELQDLNSRHGVLLNESLLINGASSPLKHRDVFKVGATLITLFAVPRAASRPAGRPRSKPALAPKHQRRTPASTSRERHSPIPSWRIPTGKGLSGVVARASLIELEAATRDALHAARASRDPEWLERIFVEFRRQMRVPSSALLTELHGLCKHLKPDPRTLDEYLEAIRGLREHVAAEDLERLPEVEAIHAELAR